MGVFDPGRLLRQPAVLTLCGAPDGHNARALAALAAAAPPGLVYVARDDARLALMQQALTFFAPGLEIVALPAWDCLPYDRVSPNAELTARRMNTLSRLLEAATGRIVLTTVNAVLQRLPPRAFVAAHAFRTAKGAKLNLERLLEFLGRSGYSRVAAVMEPGEFAVRGGIVDVFPPGADDPVRLDLFGDVVENIRRFDALSQRSTAEVSDLSLVPAGEYTLEPEAVARFRQGYRELFGAITDGDPLYESVSAGRRHPGLEHWLPLLHERMETLFQWLPDLPWAFDHLALPARDERLTAIADYHAARRKALQGKTEAGAPYRPLPPDRLYLSANDWDTGLAGRVSIHFDPFQQPEITGKVIDLEGRAGRDFAPERTQGINVLEALEAHLTAMRRQGRRVLLSCFSDGSRDRLKTILEDHGLVDLFPVESWPEGMERPAHSILLGVLPLDHGFDSTDLAAVSEQDLFGDRLGRGRRRSRRAENFIAEAGQLSPGDLVVHVDHGIARYENLVTLDIAGAPHDCLLLVYDGGDKLYLPVENVELLSRYGSDTAGAVLDRLGGVGWQTRRARLKSRLKDMAEELIKVAAARKLRTAEPLHAPDGLYDEFCARFPYDETEDQARAIDDTLDDLGSGRPMDRLICGDVGFGKTEVALRTAFVAASEGRQVAVVCPTTLLSRQHFRTFSERFKGMPVRVAQLSRLVTAKDAAETRKDLENGQVDIVVGTHALLAASIKFRNLGLLVVDEEQHFGVKHKERLKQLRADVHVLTLSATPIPRTLQLAMTGLREMSVIATPPVDRLAVRTFVMPFDPVVVREALLRELYRGGQSFYVCPRLEDLAGTMDYLRKEVPEVKPVVAHGQMPPSELEDVMNAFYDGRYNVLVSTNIVESGLDIPTANTMIVHRADMFGLAQLYQLRGRIGRAKTRAYAYFTLPADRQPTPQAERRLKVLQSLDTLGAGFQLASHDLDIRGAGNLLGEEQSGHIKEVGFELFQELLEEAVQVARAGGDEPLETGRWSPQIAIGTAVLIPETYVADLTLRLQLYRRLARLETRDELDGFAAELVDRFGALPLEVRHLLATMSIKLHCFVANIEKIDAGPRGAVLSFRNGAFPNPAALVQLIAREGANAKVRPDQKVVFVRDWLDEEKRLKGVARIAEVLAKIARPQPAALAASRSTTSKT
jgi:transcription-repair coupling factor (superfamily II helicase)